MVRRHIVLRTYRCALWYAEYCYTILFPGVRREIKAAIEDQFREFDVKVTERLILFHRKNNVPGEPSFDAPIAFLVTTRDDKPVLRMCVDLRPGLIFIRQMQGSPGSKLIRRMRDWHQSLLSACEAAADLHGVSLRVVSAARLINCRKYNPYSVEDQKRMQKRYDETALKRGYTLGRRSHRWNPTSATIAATS